MRFSVGITIHNEALNIVRLLERLHGEGLESRGLERVVVVSSASTDGSDELVRDFAKRWSRVLLITEERRSGKAAAINQFLLARGEAEVAVLLSGDVLPAPGAIDAILAGLADPAVGMTAGRPMPTGDGSGLIDRIVRLQWDLHHEVSLVAPKLGEAVAFRILFDAIPADTAVDEAAIEALLVERGYRVAYVPDAIIHNKGPETLADFLRQRRRIAAGHRHLAATSRYRVSTSRGGVVLAAVGRYLLRHPGEIPLLMAAAAVEAWGRTLGFFDLVVRGKNPYIWDVAATTKELGATMTGKEPR